MNYDGDYFNEKDHFETTSYTWESRKPFEEINAALLKAFCPSTKTVLDFGAGRGFFLKKLHDEGYERGVGLEVSEWCIEKATSEGGRIVKLSERKPPAEGVRDAIEGHIFDAVTAIFSMEHILPCDLPDLVDSLIYIARRWIMIRVPLASIKGPRETWTLHNKTSGHYTIWPMKKWIALFESSRHWCKFRHAYISQDSEDVLSATIVFFTGSKKEWNSFSDEPYPTVVCGRNEVEVKCR